jgi:hypothetical protein
LEPVSRITMAATHRAASPGLRQSPQPGIGREPGGKGRRRTAVQRRRIPLGAAVRHRPAPPPQGGVRHIAGRRHRPGDPGNAAYATLGHIDWTIGVLLAATSVPLASLGASTALRTRTERLERGYGRFLVGTSLLLLLANH